MLRVSLFTGWFVTEIISYSSGPRCPFVRPSVCVSNANISETISDIDVWLLGNSNRNPGFPIQNLPSDSRSEVRFRNFRCFRVAFSDELYRKDGTTLGIVAGQLPSRPITDDTLFNKLHKLIFMKPLWQTTDEIAGLI